MTRPAADPREHSRDRRSTEGPFKIARAVTIWAPAVGSSPALSQVRRAGDHRA
jgi:hypothetical protein